MISDEKSNKRDFVIEDHECMASIRFAELVKTVDKIRLGKAAGGEFGVYGIESSRNASRRREEFVIYRLSDGDPICLVRIPDRDEDSPSLILPTADGMGWEEDAKP